MSTAAIIVGFLLSTIGLSFFIYGKKQQRVPQLVTGMLLMVWPFLVPEPAWALGAAALTIVGLWLAVRAGW